jgi:polar amino acid transport system substrate-binding protein
VNRRRFHLLSLVAALALPAGAGARDPPSRGAPPGAAPRTLLVGGDRSYPPYEFLDGDGQPAGYNVELTRAIGHVMGLPVELRLGAWSEMRQALERGELDALQGMSWSEERTREVEFAAVHTVVAHSLFARRGGGPVPGLSGLAGKRVLVLRDGIDHDTLRRQYPAVVAVPLATHADVLAGLAAGRGDYALLAKLPGLHIVRELGLSSLVAVGDPISTERYCYAVRKGDRELAARLAEGLAILKNNGTHQAIYDRWLGVLEPAGMSWEEVLRYGAVVVAPLLLVVAATALWSRSLGRQVRERSAALSRGIAERRRVEEELRKNQQKLVQADKLAALGVLVSGVAQQIDEPNGRVLEEVATLSRAWRDLEPVLEARFAAEGDFTLGRLRYSRMRAAVPRMLAEMAAAAGRVRRIAADLGDFSRKADPELVDGVDLSAVAASALRLVEGTVRRATARFEAELPAGLPAVRANAQRIEQVVVNLVVNACQALPDRDRGLWVRTYADPAGQVVLEVRDQGTGILPEDLPRLADPFFTTKRAQGGTGLGLSVSAGIAQEHGGALAFESTPGQGTTARLVLPRPQGELRP